MNKPICLPSAVFLLLILSGCGGTKVLKKPEPLVVVQPLAAASDQSLSATLDWVIFRDGPGTWAKNVDWDEYLMRLENVGAAAFQVTKIAVVDSLGVGIEPGLNRRQLVNGTKATKRRYSGEGLKVKAGLSGGVLVGAGVVAAAGTSGLGAAAMAGGGVAVGAAAVVVLVPALAVGGVLRGVNSSKVDNQIRSRQTLLPVAVQHAEEISLHVFFPLSPSPQKVQVTYLDSRGEHEVSIDTRGALEGLHLSQSSK